MEGSSWKALVTSSRKEAFPDYLSPEGSIPAMTVCCIAPVCLYSSLFYLPNCCNYLNLMLLGIKRLP